MIEYFRILSKIVKSNLMMSGLTIQSPYYITYIVTYRCNSHCNMCGNWKIYKENPAKVHEELTAKEIKKIFCNISQPVNLTLTGGEPFLRKDLYEISKNFQELYPGLYSYGFPTNGLLTQHIIKESEKIWGLGFKNFRVSVSIDGPRVINDRIRGVKNSFKKSIDTYLRLKEFSKNRKDFAVGLNWTITPDNNGCIESFCQEIKDSFGVRVIDDLILSVSQLGFAFSNTNYSFNINREKAKADINYLLNNAKYPGLYGKLKKEFVRLCKNYLDNPRKMVIPCNSGSASCTIDPYGYLYPCTVWNRKIGSLKDTKFNVLWRSDQAKKIRNLIREERCPNCFSGCESTTSLLSSLPTFWWKLF